MAKHYNHDRGGPPRGGGRRDDRAPERLDAARAVRNGIDRAFIESAEGFGRQFEASNSQVRNIFTAVKRLEAHAGEGELDQEAFLMIKPRLAYATQRERKLTPLLESLAPAVDAVVETDDPQERDKRFRRFCLCCEAIVAYARK